MREDHITQAGAISLILRRPKLARNPVGPEDVNSKLLAVLSVGLQLFSRQIDLLTSARPQMTEYFDKTLA